MKHANIEIHEFAFYTALINDASSLKELDILELKNKDLYHRIAKVLRLSINDIIVLFDSKFHVQCNIETITKDKIIVRIKKVAENKKMQPEICWLLPLLKKEAFEDCLYTLTEMGAQEIQPIITRKSLHAASYLESDRAKNIMITAAEQSKQYILPYIHDAKPLDKILESLELQKAGSKLFFDPAGLPFFDVIQQLKHENARKIICAVGPEGDLTQSEKELLRTHNFQFCTLTETILRAKQAVVVATGILRSLL